MASLSFEVVTQHLCNKAFPLLLMFSHKSQRQIFFLLLLLFWHQVHVVSLFFCFVFFWSCGFNIALSLKWGPYLLQLTTNGLQRYLLKGPVILWKVQLVLTSENVLSITLFTFSTHMHLYFFIPVCVKGYYYRFFLFCNRRLPFSVQAGLQMCTYLCEFFWSYQSFFWRLF